MAFVSCLPLNSGAHKCSKIFRMNQSRKVLCQFTAAEPHSKLPSKLFKYYHHDKEPRTYSGS